MCFDLGSLINLGTLINWSFWQLHCQNHQLGLHASCHSTSQPTAIGRGYNAHVLPLYISRKEKAKNLAPCSVLAVF